MGNKKRKSHDEEFSDSVRKKKKPEADFKTTDFRSLLKTNTNAAFEVFISCAKQRESENDFDIVDDFCRSSVDCDDIFKILNTEKFVANDVRLVIEWLQLLLSRVAGDLKKHRPAVHPVVRHAIAYVSGPRVKWLLAMKNKSSHLKTFLKLMTAIVRQGSWAGREIATWFEVNNVHLVSLLNRRDLRDEEDVKTCLIELIASLLACDDYSVIRRLLEIKGFLNKVVADLNGDKASAVVLFLTVLHRKVVCNPNITKTSKIHFFHEQTLTDLCKLYRWSGPKHWKEMKRKPRKQFPEGGAAEADDTQFDSSNVSSSQTVVREATHLLLKDLCCSIKNGIVFHDKSFATSGQNLNHILTNFLNVLWKPDKDVLVFDLLTEILCSSPDQLQFYLPSLRLSCTPRCTSGWMQSAAFVRKIYEKQPLISPAAKYFSSVTVDELVAMIVSTVLPPGDLWSCFREAAVSSWMPVVHESLLLVAIVVKRLIVTVKHIRKLSEDGANLYFDAHHFHDLLTEAFLKELPEISTLMKYWELLVSSLDSGKSKTVTLVTNHSKLKVDDHEIQEALSEVPVSGRLSLVLRLMCGYFTLCPKFNQTVLDFSCFLDGLEKAEEQCTDEMLKTDSTSYLYLLHLLSLSGVQLEDLIDRSSDEKPSIFESLLDMMILDDKYLSSRMKHITYRLLTKLMTGCSLFSRNSEEVEIWLKHLMSLSLEQRRDCVHLFISSVKKLLKNSVLTAANALEKQSLGFSGLVMVILKQNKDQDEFVDGVLVDIFHLYPYSSVLCKAARKSKLPRFSGLLNRLKCNKVESSTADLQSPDLMGLLEKCFVFGLSLACTAFYQSAVSLVQLLPLSDCNGVIRQIISYLLISIRQFIQGDKSRKEEIVFYLDVAIQVAEHSRILEMKQSGRDEVPEQIVNEDELLMLNISEHNGGRVFYQLCSAMFHSAVVEKYFLWKMENDSSCENPTYASKVSELVTQKFSTFVREISAFLPPDEFPILETPVKRVEEAVKNFTIESCKEDVLDAVEAFVGFTRPSVVKHFTEKLLLEYKTHLTDENGKLNEFGKVFLKAFKLSAKSNGETPKFSDEFLTAAFDWADVGSPEYCDLLVSLVKGVPVASSFIQRDTIDRLLEMGGHDVLSVVAELVCNDNRKCLKQVSKWLTGNKRWKKLRDDYQSLVYEVTKRSSEDKGLCEIVLKIYWKHMLDLVFSNSFQDFDSNCDVPANFLRQLIAYADSDGINECWERLTSALCDRLLLTPARIRFYFTLCEDLLARNVSESQYQCCNFVNTCIQLLTTQLSSKVDDDDDDASIQVLMNGITKLLEVHILGTANLQKCLGTSWDGFLKAGLKHHNTDCHFLKLLETLIGQLYPLEEEEEEEDAAELTFKSSVLPEDIFEMIIGLSLFLPTVLKTSEDNVKDGVISLLYCLVQRSSRCCKASHIGFLLGAYGATLSATDQRILMLLHCYEIAGCSMTEFKPYFWGPRAIENHASNKTLGMSLLPENRMEQIIDLLDKPRVYRSILNFPLRRRLEFGDKVRDANFLKTREDCYDPVFLLPLFNHLFEPGSAVNCVKFIECHCLGFVVASLSCYNSGIRSVAYHTLSAFQKHLDRSRFPERLQVSYVLECLHNSVKEPNQKFASVITVFLAKAIDLMLSPKDHMYSLINEFLLLKPAMDVANVPEFYKLFYATGLEFKTERLWMLNLLLDGLRDTHDYHIMEKRLTFKIIMSFYTFGVSDHMSKMVVLKILTKACGIKTVAKDLIESHGLLSWIANVSADIIREKRSAHMTAGVVNGVVEMLHVLWTTVAVTDHNDRTCLQPVVTAEMVATLTKVYRHFQNSLGETARETCEKMLLFVREYSRKTCELYPDWKDAFQ